MEEIVRDDLKPEAYYWAKASTDGVLKIVQVSTVFGTESEFLTAALIGTDEHRDLEDFQFIEEILPPWRWAQRDQGNVKATA